MDFEMKPKENPRDVFLEHCVNKGNNFEVEIIHWHMIDDEEKANEVCSFMGNECWNVYAIIYKDHPLYKNLCNLTDDDYSGAADSFPFYMHGGITYVRNDGDSIKIGDDYMHWGDELTQKSKELPGEVKWEAEELFKFLSKGE